MLDEYTIKKTIPHTSNSYHDTEIFIADFLLTVRELSFLNGDLLDFKEVYEIW